jgi:hypothetical protein
MALVLHLDIRHLSCLSALFFLQDGSDSAS